MLVYISYIIYSIYIILGILTYNRILIEGMIEKQKEIDVLSHLAVPEWMNFFAALISVATLVYFERFVLSFLLLIASYGNYRLYAKILTKI